MEEVDGTLRGSEASEDTSENLILLNAHDRIISQIGKEKAARKQAREAEKKAKRDAWTRPIKHRFARVFFALSDQFFNLSKERIRGFSNEELLELEKEVARRTFTSALGTRLLFQTQPLGWLAYVVYHGIQQNNRYKVDTNGYNPRPSESWTYRFLRGQLQKAYGKKDWFPYDEVKQGPRPTYPEYGSKKRNRW